MFLHERHCMQPYSTSGKMYVITLLSPSKKIRGRRFEPCGFTSVNERKHVRKCNESKVYVFVHNITFLYSGSRELEIVWLNR
jgi:hypothetical protein